MNLTYYPFLKKLSVLYNIELSEMNFQTASNLFDSINVNLYMGKNILNENFTQADFENLQHLYNWHNFLKFSGNLTKVVNSGKLTKLLQQLDNRIKHPNVI